MEMIHRSIQKNYREGNLIFDQRRRNDAG